MNECRTQYLSALSLCGLAELQLNIERAFSRPDNIGVEFDAIAFSGQSGALAAPLMAKYLQKDLILVRKNTEDCHSTMMVEGAVNAARYIIVDDMYSSGDTLIRIADKIKKAPRDGDTPPKCVGVFLYCSGVFYHEKSPNRLQFCLHKKIFDFSYELPAVNTTLMSPQSPTYEVRTFKASELVPMPFATYELPKR